MAVSHVFSNTIGNWTGTVTVGNSDGNTLTMNATDLVRPQDWNSAHNQFFTLTGNTSGNSTASGTDVIFAGSGNITLGGSTNSLVISGPLLDFYSNQPLHVAQNIQRQQNNSTASIIPFALPNPTVCSIAKVIFSLDPATAANASSAYIDLSASMVIYTRNVSTLSSVTSFAMNGTMSWSSNNTTSAVGNFNIVSMTGNAVTLAANSYWAALHISTTNTATGGANTTALSNAISMFGIRPNIASNAFIHGFNAATNSTVHIYQGGGVLNTNASRASLAFTDYTQASTSMGNVNNIAFYFELLNNTYQ